MKTKSTTKTKWDNPKAMYALALSYLAKRDYSSDELATKLSRKTHQENHSPAISALIQQLQKDNLLNDLRFAKNYSQKRAHQGYGKLRIQAELKQRGILLANMDIKINTDIHKIREKKFGKRLPIEATEKAQQTRYLSYKGFTFDEIQSALKYNRNNDHEHDHENDQ